MRKETVLIVHRYETIQNIIAVNLKILGFKNFIFKQYSVDIFNNVQKSNLLICDYNIYTSTIEYFLDEIIVPKLIVINCGISNIEDVIIHIAKGGADNYIITPFSTNQLQQKLNKIFDKYNMEQLKNY